MPFFIFAYCKSREIPSRQNREIKYNKVAFPRLPESP